MKILGHLRQDAARLAGLGVAVGLAASSILGVAHAAEPAQPDTTAGSSPLSRSIFAAVAPAPTLSPQLSAAIDEAIKTLPERAAGTAAPARFQRASLARAASGRTLPQGGEIAFELPLPGHAVNSRFGLRQLSFEPHARMHDGVDIAAPIGSPIHATAAGVVTRTGLSSSYGRFVQISHGDGLSSFYAHMSRTAGLRPGTRVAAGEVVGYVGSTGHSTGPHLHFEIRDDGKPLNPQDFMGRVLAVADLPAIEARAGEVFGVIRHYPMRVLAAWRTHRRVAHVRYAEVRHGEVRHGRFRLARG